MKFTPSRIKKKLIFKVKNKKILFFQNFDQYIEITGSLNRHNFEKKKKGINNAIFSLQLQKSALSLYEIPRVTQTL